MAAERNIAFSETRIGDVLVLVCHGSHYHADRAAQFGQALESARGKADGGKLVIDFSRVVLLSSTVLRALRVAHAAFDEVDGRIAAAGGGELVWRVLKFAPFIDHYQDVEMAISAMSAAGSLEKGL